MKTTIILFVAMFITFTTFAQKSKGDSVASKHKATTQTLYTCAMHPDYLSTTTGTCPECNSKLVVDRTSSKQGKLVYTCAMHPDVISGKPGKCSICGMAMTETRIKAKTKKG